MKKRREKKNWRKEITEWIVIFAIAIILSVFVNQKLIVNAQIPSSSMEATIKIGDRIIGNRLSYHSTDPKRFDIILFKYPDNESKIYIKRIIGLPGETVNIIDGNIYINDSKEPLDDSFIKEPMRGSFGPYTVPENHYFMLGDNRNVSEDSRFWKNTYVSRDKILGKAVFRLWPINKIGTVE